LQIPVGHHHKPGLSVCDIKDLNLGRKIKAAKTLGLIL